MYLRPLGKSELVLSLLDLPVVSDSVRKRTAMPRFFNSTYSPLWDYQHKTLRARLFAMMGGFDKDVLERFYALTPDQLTRLISIYSNEYGDGPAAYASKTYNDWR